MSIVSERFMNEIRMRNKVGMNRAEYKIPEDFDIESFTYEELETIIEIGDATGIIRQKN